MCKFVIKCASPQIRLYRNIISEIYNCTEIRKDGDDEYFIVADCYDIRNLARFVCKPIIYYPPEKAEDYDHPQEVFIYDGWIE